MHFTIPGVSVNDVLMGRTCSLCGCTHETPCGPILPCYWLTTQPDGKPLCSHCATVGQLLADPLGMSWMLMLLANGCEGLTFEPHDCDHPWHENPGLLVPCPSCGTGSDKPEGVPVNDS